MIRQLRLSRSISREPGGDHRRGGFMVLAAFCLIAAMGFVSLCVDVGYLSLSKQRMQNGVDAAALAAAMEITNAVQTAGADVTNVTAYAEAQARLKARDVAALNGLYIDPNRDVVFGQRVIVDQSGNTQTNWNVSPPNVVKVTAHRDNPDATAPDAKLRLFFAGVLGDKTASLATSAAAYVESRDIAVVLDFSGSMNDDSTYSTLGTRDRTALENNMRDIWNILDGLRDLGDLEFEPDWLTQTASSGQMNGAVVFRNTEADLTTSHNITSIRLTFDDGSTQTTNYDYSEEMRAPPPLKRNYGSKPINEVRVDVQYQDFGDIAQASNSSGSKNANVTFNGEDVSVTTNQSMSKIKLVYYPSGNQQFSASGRSGSANGNGSYISQVQVRIGSTWVTVNNPNGSTPDVVKKTLTFTDSIDNVKTFFNLNGTWPWASQNWSNFVSYCRDDSQIDNAGYKRKYGGKCLVNYLLTRDMTYVQCNDLWRTPHYPFHSLKQGTQLFANFLDDLNFGDEMGMVSYATSAVREDRLTDEGFNIDMRSNPVCDRFVDFKSIIEHKQAGHYTNTTNIGDGLKQGKLLLDASKRPGTRPTLLLMTDGLANVKDNSYSLPGDWSWNTLFDYDGDGSSDYSTSDSYAKYALGMAKEAVDAGYTIHTMSVGLGADTDLLKAIAWLGRGIYIEVPGTLSVAEMEGQVKEAFNRIAAFVPPAKLVPTE